MADAAGGPADVGDARAAAGSGRQSARRLQKRARAGTEAGNQVSVVAGARQAACSISEAAGEASSSEEGEYGSASDGEDGRARKAAITRPDGAFSKRDIDVMTQLQQARSNNTKSGSRSAWKVYEEYHTAKGRTPGQMLQLECAREYFSDPKVFPLTTKAFKDPGTHQKYRSEVNGQINYRRMHMLTETGDSRYAGELKLADDAVIRGYEKLIAMNKSTAHKANMEDPHRQQLQNRVASIPPNSMNFMPKAGRRKLTVRQLYHAYVHGAEQFAYNPRYPTLREVLAAAEQPYAVMGKLAKHSEVTFCANYIALLKAVDVAAMTSPASDDSIIARFEVEVNEAGSLSALAARYRAADK